MLSCDTTEPFPVSTLLNLGVGDERSEEVVDGYEAFFCCLFLLKQNEVHKTKGPEMDAVYSAQAWSRCRQASTNPRSMGEYIRANIWAQDIIQDPITLDPLTLGWK